jgi:Coenzyme PQQ synthesis protein D (PqqD)
MRIEKSSQTVFTPLADGTGVLLNLDTLAYYKLNRTAAALWQEIDSGSARSLDDLVQHTCEKYDVDDQHAHTALGEFLTHLAEFKMIHLA